MIVVDTSLLVALLNEDDANHARAVRWYQRTHDALATTPLVLSETDHLVLARLGRAARTAFRADVAEGAYDVTWWPDAPAQAVGVAERYADLGLDLTDATLVALAARLDTVEMATFDERHFRAVRPLSAGPAFRLLPADA